MLDFQPIMLEQKAAMDACLLDGQNHSCEYSFANLFLWGRQKAVFLDGQLLLFSQFDRRTVYPFPPGPGDKKKALDAIIADAHDRGIPCRITGLDDGQILLLEQLYPGRFRFHCDRDSYDYVYAIDELAELKGRKFQKKRNHIHKFQAAFPDYHVEPLTAEKLPQVQAMVDRWYASRVQEDPQTDYLMEQAALNKALRCWEQLQMRALVLCSGEAVLAFTMGSLLTADTLDVHFEKAAPEVPEAYPVINWQFARYIRQTMPQIRFVNREDDMGLEGLRKAKLSYCPDHLVKKCWAHLLEEGYDY